MTRRIFSFPTPPIIHADPIEMEKMRELLTSRVTATGRQPLGPSLPRYIALEMSKDETVRRLMAALGNYRPQFVVKGDPAVLAKLDLSGLEEKVEAQMQREMESTQNLMVYGIDPVLNEVYFDCEPTRYGKSLNYVGIERFAHPHLKMGLRTFRRITKLHKEWMRPRWDYVPDEAFKNHRIPLDSDYSIFPKEKNKWSIKRS